MCTLRGSFSSTLFRFSLGWWDGGVGCGRFGGGRREVLEGPIILLGAKQDQNLIIRIMTGHLDVLEDSVSGQSKILDSKTMLTFTLGLYMSSTPNPF
jgi:hypothetical protein